MIAVSNFGSNCAVIGISGHSVDILSERLVLLVNAAGTKAVAMDRMMRIVASFSIIADLFRDMELSVWMLMTTQEDCIAVNTCI